ncbi:MAG: hypothetical protein GY928_36600 [Colwellia sp.]|nr:hypothetical protein [Colwellia sp.]
MKTSGAYNRGVRHDKSIKLVIVTREQKRKVISDAEQFAKKVMEMML